MNRLEDSNHSSMMAKKYRQMHQWIAAKWMDYVADNFGIAFACFGFGLIVAVVLLLPFFHWPIPAGATPVFASSASAFIGAGLAAIIARRALVRGDAETRKTVSDVIREVVNQLSTTDDMLKRENKDFANYQDFKVIKEQLGTLGDAVTHSIDRLKLLSSSHAQIRFGRGIAIPDAQLAIDAIKKNLNAVINSLDTDRENATKVSYNQIFPKSVDNAEKCFDKELRPQLEKLDAALLRLGHPRTNISFFYQQGEQGVDTSRREQTDTWILGKMSYSEAFSRFLNIATAPLFTSLVAGILFMSSPKWMAIGQSIIISHTNTPLLKVALGFTTILFPATVILQLFKSESYPYQILISFMRFVVDAISSTMFTGASVVLGVFFALGILSLHDSCWCKGVSSAISGILLMLITNVIAYFVSKIVHSQDEYLLGAAQKETWIRVLFISVALAMMGLGVWYLGFHEKFCEVNAIKHAQSECKS